MGDAASWRQTRRPLQAITRSRLISAVDNTFLHPPFQNCSLLSFFYWHGEYGPCLLDRRRITARHDLPPNASGRSLRPPRGRSSFRPLITPSRTLYSRIVLFLHYFIRTVSMHGAVSAAGPRMNYGSARLGTYGRSCLHLLPPLLLRTSADLLPTITQISCAG